MDATGMPLKIENLYFNFHSGNIAHIYLLNRLRKRLLKLGAC